MRLFKIPILLILLAVFLLGSGLTPASAQAGPTPVPGTVEKVNLPAAGNQGNSPGMTSPVVGILVLLAPLVFVAWKSRGKKQPNITSASCLPVIDENGKGGFLNQD